ncbi:hypothetical protein P280DRAFT_326449 [Massarina eburnea CBS 473.64]|uniref:Uncharacterized protein n=1 Tax=Massarina eburnea CBS 473.64 TaxID=1395130 RepID=A0A6A6S0P5_9PLEO|nr:hypothetical protein P280DRAFT_326449 [Massarina eburnea CBS 473.64]
MNTYSHSHWIAVRTRSTAIPAGAARRDFHAGRSSVDVVEGVGTGYDRHHTDYADAGRSSAACLPVLRMQHCVVRHRLPAVEIPALRILLAVHIQGRHCRCHAVEAVAGTGCDLRRIDLLDADQAEWHCSVVGAGSAAGRRILPAVRNRSAGADCVVAGRTGRVWGRSSCCAGRESSRARRLRAGRTSAEQCHCTCHLARCRDCIRSHLTACCAGGAC